MLSRYWLAFTQHPCWVFLFVLSVIMIYSSEAALAQNASGDAGRRLSYPTWFVPQVNKSGSTSEFQKAMLAREAKVAFSVPQQGWIIETVGFYESDWGETAVKEREARSLKSYRTVIRALEGLFPIVSIDLSGAGKLSDNDLQELCDRLDLSHLKSVHFAVSEGARRGIERILTNSKCLGKISIQGPTRMSDHIAQLAILERLHTIRVIDSAFGDSFLKVVHRLPRLRSLCLDGTTFSRSGFESISHLTQLEELSVCRTDVSDEWCSFVQTLVHLKFLYFNCTQVTDACIPQLVRLEALTCLALGGTQVTENGISEFRQMRPRCEVFWGTAKEVKRQ